MYFMRVENVFPNYKSAHERAKSVQETYTELQIILYNNSEKRKDGSQSKNEQIIKFKKG